MQCYQTINPHSLVASHVIVIPFTPSRCPESTAVSYDMGWSGVTFHLQLSESDSVQSAQRDVKITRTANLNSRMTRHPLRHSRTGTFRFPALLLLQRKIVPVFQNKKTHFSPNLKIIYAISLFHCFSHCLSLFYDYLHSWVIIIIFHLFLEFNLFFFV